MTPFKLIFLSYGGEQERKECELQFEGDFLQAERGLDLRFSSVFSRGE